MDIELRKINCLELDNRELANIFAGAPSADSGFWYDASYYATTLVVEWVKYTETHSPVPRGEVY